MPHRFIVSADAMFEAESLQDALWKIGNYYVGLGNAMNGDEPIPDTIFTMGQIEIKPARQD